MREKIANIKSIGSVRYYATKARDPEKCEAILSLLWDEEPRVARNAAWIMTHFSRRRKMELRNRQNDFIDLAMSTGNSGLRRLLLNVIEVQGIREEDLRTDFLDFCLTHMMAPEEPPGVQSLCMKLAFAQCLFYPELLHEYRETLLIMQQGFAISMVGLRKRMLKKVDKALEPKKPKKKKEKKKKSPNHQITKSSLNH